MIAFSAQAVQFDFKDISAALGLSETVDVRGADNVPTVEDADTGSDNKDIVSAATGPSDTTGSGVADDLTTDSTTGESPTGPLDDTGADTSVSQGVALEGVASELFAEFDYSLHADTFLSNRTRAHRMAYYESLARDVAVAMVENVDADRASQYLGIPVEVFTDPDWQIVGEHAIVDLFQD